MRYWLFLFALSIGFQAHAESVEKLESRGATVRYLLAHPPDAKAIAILFTGGDGRLGLGKWEGKAPDKAYPRGNFLVRTRARFAGAGMMVAVPDAPSDRPAGMDEAFRTGPEHAEDIARLIDALRDRARIPVWLVGTSAGTYSAAALAIRLGNRIDGLILTSPLTKFGTRPELYPPGILAYDLDKIRVPALVLAHGADNCFASPPYDSPRIGRALAAAPRVAVRSLTGGLPPESSACEPLAPHGFFGIEAEAVAEIAAFVFQRPAQ